MSPAAELGGAAVSPSSPFVGAPGHAADLDRYRARGTATRGNRIAIVMDRPRPAVF